MSAVIVFRVLWKHPSALRATLIRGTLSLFTLCLVVLALELFFKQFFVQSDGFLLTYAGRNWVRDNWNHPSLVIWDTCNETHDAVFGEKVIPAARKLDLSGRPWENGYNLPAVPGDPVEDHPYLFIRSGMHDDAKFEIQDPGKWKIKGALGDLLNAQPPETFTPNLNQLDALVQSMQIVP